MKIFLMTSSNEKNERLMKKICSLMQNCSKEAEEAQDRILPDGRGRPDRRGPPQEQRQTSPRRDP
jgi:hypothetical protein